MTYVAPIIPDVGLLGANLTTVDTVTTATPEYPGLPLTIGTVAATSNGGRYIYVTAAGTIAQYDFVCILPAFTATALTSTNASTASYIGCAQVAIASASSGWVAMQGNATGNVLASAALNVALYATATPGYLDDAGTASTKVNGIVLIATKNSVSGSGAVVMTYPVAAEV